MHRPLLLKEHARRFSGQNWRYELAANSGKARWQQSMMFSKARIVVLPRLSVSRAYTNDSPVDGKISET